MTRTSPSRHELRPMTAGLALGLALLVSVVVPLEAREPPGSRVEGTVAGVQGEVVSGARVEVASLQDPALVATATADAEGRFELEVEGAPGRFRIRVAAQGYEPFESELVIAEGERKEVGFQLLPSTLARRQEAIESYNAGAEAFQQGDQETARARWEESMALEPELPEPYLALAKLHMVQDRPGEALAPLQVYLAARPEDEDAHRIAYEAYRKVGDEEGMAREAGFLRDTDVVPAVAADVYNLGVAAYQGGRRDEALAKFEEALALDPSLAPAAAAISTILYEQERFEESLAAAEGLLEQHPEDLKGLRLRFLALEALGRSTAAALDAYAAAAPDAAVALLLDWARQDFESDEPGQARALLEQVLAIRPDQPQAHYTLGLVYASGGDNAKAKEHLRRFVDLAPDDPEAEIARAMIAEL